MTVGDPFKEIFGIPGIPEPKELIDPTPPLIRPEAKPPVVYDVPIPRYIHPEERDVIIETPEGSTVKTIIEPGYRETVIRTLDPTYGDVIKVQDVATGAVDIFPIDPMKKPVIDPGSRRDIDPETRDVIYNIHYKTIYEPGGFDWSKISWTPFGQAALFTEGFQEGGILGGFQNVGAKTFTKKGGGTDWGSTLIFGALILGGAWLTGKFLGRK